MRTFEMTDDTKEWDSYKATFYNTGLLDDLRDKTEQAMRTLADADFEIYRPKMLDSYFPYSTRSNKEKENYYIAMFSVAQNEDNWQYVPIDLRTDEFMRTAFRLNPRVVKYIPYSRVKDEFIELIARFNPDLLKHVHVNENKAIAMTAITLNPSVFLTLDKEMQSYDDVIYVATVKPKGSNIRDEFYEQNKEYVKTVLNKELPSQSEQPKQDIKKPKEKSLFSGPIFTLKRDSKDKK